MNAMIKVTEDKPLDQQLWKLWETGAKGNYIYQLAEAIVNDDKLRAETLELLMEVEK